MYGMMIKPNIVYGLAAIVKELIMDDTNNKCFFSCKFDEATMLRLRSSAMGI